MKRKTKEEAKRNKEGRRKKEKLHSSTNTQHCHPPHKLHNLILLHLKLPGLHQKTKTQLSDNHLRSDHIKQKPKQTQPTGEVFFLERERLVYDLRRSDINRRSFIEQCRPWF